MKKSAMFLGCILVFGMVFHVGSGTAQDTASGKGTATTKGTATGKSTATGTGTAAGRKAKASGAKTAGSSPIVLKDQKDKLSYALGMNMGTNLQSNLHKDAIDVDSNLVVQGMKDAMAGGKLLMTEAEARAALTELQNDLMAKQREAMASAGQHAGSTAFADPGELDAPEG